MQNNQNLICDFQIKMYMSHGIEYVFDTIKMIKISYLELKLLSIFFLLFAVGIKWNPPSFKYDDHKET